MTPITTARRILSSGDVLTATNAELRAILAAYLESEAAIERLREELAALRAMSAAMAADEGLWFQAETCAEAYLQQELRKLCAAIEEGRKQPLQSLLKPATTAPAPPVNPGPLIPYVRFPDGTKRRLTPEEWEEAKQAMAHKHPLQGEEGWGMSELRSALLAMFLAAEKEAVCSCETCTYPGGEFNDRIWREDDPSGFAVAQRARRLLGLKPFRHRDARDFGRGDDRLAEFRAKEREAVEE